MVSRISLAGIHLAIGQVGKDRVTLQLGHSQRRGVARQQGFEERLEDGVGVIQLRASQESCVAGNIAEEEVTCIHYNRKPLKNHNNGLIYNLFYPKIVNVRLSFWLPA
jgi:hypothetical protein